MKAKYVEIQIGKNGLTEGTIELLKTAFSSREGVKVHVLKSAGHDREKVKEIGEKIINELGLNYTYKILGFTLFLKKWRKPKR